MTTNMSMLTLRLPISYWVTETQTRLVNFCLFVSIYLIKEMLHCVDFTSQVIIFNCQAAKWQGHIFSLTHSCYELLHPEKSLVWEMTCRFIISCRCIWLTMVYHTDTVLMESIKTTKRTQRKDTMARLSIRALMLTEV